MNRNQIPMRLFPIVTALVLLMPAPAAAQGSRGREAILRLDSLWARMYHQHDTATALAMYSEHLVFTAANGQRKTRAQEMADVRPYPGMVVEYFRTSPDSVRVWADSAVVSGRASWKYTTNGQAREVRRTYTHLWVRGGPLGWQISRVTMGIVR